MGSFTFEHREPNMRWSDEAAAALVGQTVPVHVSELRDIGAEGETGRVTACEAVRDGEALRMTLEVSDELADLVNALTYHPGADAVSINQRRPAIFDQRTP